MGDSGGIRESMKLTLKSGTVITDSSCDVATWKGVLKNQTTVQYSTDDDGLILFNSSEIREIYFSPEEIAKTMRN